MKILRWVCLFALASTGAALAAAPAPANPWVPTLADKYRDMGWELGRFRSALTGTDVGYLIYLPPDYRTSRARRFPVLYWLHGLSSSPVAASQISTLLRAPLCKGRGPSMLVVACVDPTKRSMWTDSKSGRYPVESVIVDELIPYIDSHYRTVSTREGRGVEGFSMGGYGAAYLGFKYPDLFGSVSMLSAALHTPTDLRDRRRRIFNDVFGGDLNYAGSHSPWRIVNRNAARIRGRTRIRLFVGEKDRFLLADENFHRLLQQLEIPHQFGVVPRATHSAREFFANFPGDFLKFQRTAFAPTLLNASLQAPGGVRAVRGLTYARVGARELTLDLFLPEEARGKVPLVVWIHGGAWRTGSKEHSPAIPLVEHGFAVASIDYRLSGEAKFPAQIEDCKAAIRWLRANSELYGLDAAHIGVWGQSAGGHLAALAGTSGNARELEGNPDLRGVSSAVQAVVDFFGPTDLLRMSAFPSRLAHDAPDSPESQLVGGPLRQNAAKAEVANPIRYVSAGDPPFLILHGDRDDQVPLNQSELLEAALRKAGVPVTYHVLRGAGHGGPAFFSPEAWREVVDFFTRYLKAGTLKASLQPLLRTRREAVRFR